MTTRTLRPSLLALALALSCGGAFAQSTTAPAAPAAAAPAAASPQAPAQPPASPAKKELVQRVLKLQQGGVERLATAMTEEPALLLGGRASEVIAAKIPRERQEAIAKEVREEIQKYLKETVPQVRKSAQQLAPATIGPMLEAQFSEDELKQVIALLESPAFAKYQQFGGEMQQALQGKLVAETKASVEPRVQALEKAIGDKLKAATSTPAAAPAPATKAPSKAAK